MRSVIRLLRLPVDVLWLTLDLSRLILWAAWTRVLRAFGAEAMSWGPFCSGVESSAAQARVCPVARKYGAIGMLRALCPAAQVAASGERVCTYQGDYEKDVYVPYWGRVIGIGLALLVLWSAIGAAVQFGLRKPASSAAAPVAVVRRGSAPDTAGPVGAPKPPPTVAREATQGRPRHAPAAEPTAAPQPKVSPKPRGTATGGEGKAEKFLKSGDQYFAAEQYLEALIEYKNAVQRDPDSARARLGVGQCYLRLGRGVRDARYEMEKAAQLDPALAEAHRELCKLAFIERDVKRAAQHAKRLKELAPDDPEAGLMLAACLDAGGDPDAALKEISAATGRAGAASKTFTAAGDLHLKQRNFDQAEAAYRQALEQDPSDRVPRVGLAAALRSQGKLDDAKQQLDLALQEAPEDTLAAVEQAELQVARRDVAAAIETLEELTRREPKLYDSRARLAQLLVNARRTDAGVAVAKQTLQESPRHVGSHLVLARTFVSRGLHTMALEHCDRAMAVDRGNVPARCVRARVYLAKRQHDDAVRELRMAVEAAPDRFAARMLLGRAYLATERLDEAKECYETVAKQYPESPTPHMQLGSIQVRKGLPEAAILHYEEARRRTPNSPVAANNIATLLLDLGTDLDRAYRLASDLRKRFPGFPAGSDTYGWACYKRGEYQKAVDALAFAARRMARRPEVRYHYGMALYKTGKMKEAREELEVSLKLSTKFPGAADAKATLAKMGRAKSEHPTSNIQGGEEE